MATVSPRGKSEVKALKRSLGAEVDDDQLAQEEARRQKNLKKVKVLGEKDESEKLLEDLVFGADDELVDRLTWEDEENVGSSLIEEESSESEVENEARLPVQPARKAAWEDEDEDEGEDEVDMTHRYRRDFMKGDAEKRLPKQKLQQRLQEQFKRAMGGTPSWAERAEKSKKKGKKHSNDEDEDHTDDEDDDLLRKTGNFVASSESLPKGIIQIKNCLNANNDRPSEGRLTTVQFHPSAQVVMTAGMDQSVSFFQVDGKTNPKIQSIHLEKFPVHKAQFSADGEQVVATSIHNKLFYVYDMMEGKIIPVYTVRGLSEKKVKDFEVSPDGGFLLLSGTSGYLHLVTMKTKELVRSLKINGEVTGAAFSSDGGRVYTSSDEGEVFIWDLKSSRCMNRFADDGSLRGTSIAVSRNGQYLACGSSSGVVNVYSHDTCLQESNPKPLKAIMNLLTPATSLRFNPSTEILAIASSAADEAVRLVHIPSFTVFSNFPVSRRKNILLPQSLDFSPRSGFFSVANNKGRAVLYRLKHYTDF
ncbi:U3 small nucleolar RNA-associated protein 18 homolog isoform X2 [Megalops cyprinoides]|uniref:U3 small nucleolar RNA-associated protein 18 homolog isoform X2 n=1 Tax=Megalops cyprinoides TaxID=118141 RepID=UPI0018654A2F|nr:U3 small nucleolar RNA-associated protein 18 homolog isoform X2 [Megalops cyprinoides]